MATRLQRVITWIVSISLLLVSNMANSLMVNDLYTWQVQVQDNGEQLRREQIARAFDEVLMRVACSREVLQHPEVVAARNVADRYVNSFAYQALSMVDADQQVSYKLNLHFNGAMLGNLVSKTGHKVLASSRPLLLLWLVVERDGQFEFVGNSVDQLGVDVEKLARGYGLPLVMPLLDLPERMFITEHDVVVANEDILMQAALRYNADAVVVGVMRQEDGVWNTQWRMLSGEKRASVLESRENDLAVGVERVFGRLADDIVAQYGGSYKKDEQNIISLRVTGINDVGEYAKVFDYLRSLNVVKKVEVANIAGNTAIFNIVAEGGKDALNRAISLNHVLLLELNAGGKFDADSLVYRVG